MIFPQGKTEITAISVHHVLAPLAIINLYYWPLVCFTLPCLPWLNSFLLSYTMASPEYCDVYFYKEKP